MINLISKTVLLIKFYENADRPPPSNYNIDYFYRMMDYVATHHESIGTVCTVIYRVLATRTPV